MPCIIGKKEEKGALALKLDISKAYDRVEWPFLKGMMTKIGFPIVWIDRVMSCVTTPSFSIVLMVKLLVTYSHLGGFVKETPYRLIIFFYVQKVSRLC